MIIFPVKKLEHYNIATASLLTNFLTARESRGPKSMKIVGLGLVVLGIFLNTWSTMFCLLGQSSIVYMVNYKLLSWLIMITDGRYRKIEKNRKIENFKISRFSENEKYDG